MNQDLLDAKIALDKIIKKSRVHFYKPIQIAEILFQHRCNSNIKLDDREEYRNLSKQWRNEITAQFLGTVCTSSARFQDDLFNENAIPPKLLSKLGEFNRANNGIIEAHIYKAFSDKYAQLSFALTYCLTASRDNFQLQEFLDLFWQEAGLRRSIDKIFEIIIYSLFETIVYQSGLVVEVYVQKSPSILEDFPEFLRKVIGLKKLTDKIKLDAHFHRVGVTNAADRGIDIIANFGSVIQVKHLSLSEQIAENITSTVTAHKIVIVCKNAELSVIQSLLNQIGWHSRIQAIITLEELAIWYHRALQGKYADVLGDALLDTIKEQIQEEFPSLAGTDFQNFLKKRGYFNTHHSDWQSFD